jgi:hypothetical protein
LSTSGAKTARVTAAEGTRIAATIPAEIAAAAKAAGVTAATKSASLTAAPAVTAGIEPTAAARRTTEITTAAKPASAAATESASSATTVKPAAAAARVRRVCHNHRQKRCRNDANDAFHKATFQESREMLICQPTFVSRLACEPEDLHCGWLALRFALRSEFRVEDKRTG